MRAKFVNEAVKHLSPRSEEEIITRKNQLRESKKEYFEILDNLVTISGDTLIFLNLKKMDVSSNVKAEFYLYRNLPLYSDKLKKIKESLGWKRIPKKYLAKEYHFEIFDFSFPAFNYCQLFSDIYGELWYYDDLDLVQGSHTIVGLYQYKDEGLTFKKLVELLDKYAY